MDSVHKIIFWNTQGAGNEKFLRNIKELIHSYDPILVVLMETRISGITADNIIRKMGLLGNARVEARGFAGGFGLFGDPIVFMFVFWGLLLK